MNFYRIWLKTFRSTRHQIIKYGLSNHIVNLCTLTNSQFIVQNVSQLSLGQKNGRTWQIYNGSLFAMEPYNKICLKNYFIMFWFKDQRKFCLFVYYSVHIK